MVVIFDLDGTLVDTYPVIRKTLIEVFDNYLPDLKYDEELLKGFFGPTLVESFSKLTNDDKLTQDLIAVYRKINSVYYERELELFPDAVEALEKISKDNKLAILSNRIQSLVDVALVKTKIGKYFETILGVDSIPKPKPEPDGINQILEKYKTKSAVFIGDALTDVITAQRAGIISIGVTWALTKRHEFEEINTDYIADDFEELIRILEEINV